MTQVPSTMDLEAVHEAAIVVAHHRLGRRVKGVDLAQRSDRTRILRVKRQMRLGATGEEIADEICTILVGSIAVMRFTGSSEIKSLEAEEFAWERRQLARLQQSLRLSPEDFRFHRDRGFARAKRVTGRNFMAIKEVTQAILIAPGNRLSGRDVRRIIDANPEDPTMCQF